MTANRAPREQQRPISGRTKTGISKVIRRLAACLLQAEADRAIGFPWHSAIEGRHKLRPGELYRMTDAQHRPGVLEHNPRSAEGTERLTGQRLTGQRLEDTRARDGAPPVQPKLIIGCMLAASAAMRTSMSDDALSTPGEVENGLNASNFGVVTRRRAA